MKRQLAEIWPVAVTFALTLWGLHLAKAPTEIAATILVGAAVGWQFGWLAGEFKAKFGVGLPFGKKEQG